MNAQLIFFVELLLVLLVIAGIVAISARDARQTLRVLSGAAVGMLLAADLLIGVAGYRQFSVDTGLGHLSDTQRLIVFAALQLLVLGVGLAMGAWALAAGQMARSREWSWFTGLLVAALLIPLAGAALYSPQMLLGASASASITQSGTLLGLPYFPIAALLLLVAPLAALTYSLTRAQASTGMMVTVSSSRTRAPAAPRVSNTNVSNTNVSDANLRAAAADELRFQHSIWPILTLAALQLLLGYQWLLSGVDKLLYGSFPETMSTLLQQSLSGGRLPGFFADFMRTFVLPNPTLFGALVEAGETLAGVGLIGSAIVELLRPFADRHGGWLAATFKVGERLLDILAPLAAAGTLMLGLSYYFLDGAPALLPTASIAYGGALNSGFLLALGSIVLLLGHYAHRKAITRTRELERQVEPTVTDSSTAEVSETLEAVAAGAPPSSSY